MIIIFDMKSLSYCDPYSGHDHVFNTIEKVFFSVCQINKSSATNF